MNSTQPNIILFLVDDQAWSGTSIKKYHPYRADTSSDFFEMPNLKWLASQGMRFVDAYAPATLCAPSRISIQTGVSPAKLRATTFCGIRRDGLVEQKRHPEQWSIPELIKRTHPNYRTAHFGKWHIYGHTPAEFGYDESDGPVHNLGSYPHWSSHEMVTEDPKRIWDITGKATDFIERQAHQGQLFFLQISHYAVHTPVECSAEALRKFEGKRSGWKDSHPGYAAMCSDLDRGLGKIMETVDHYGLSDNTWIIYTSDNGGNACDDVSLANLNLPLRKGKQFLHEGGIRVPFVIKGPGIPAGKLPHASFEPVIGYDLLPTIADLLGITELPEGVEGTSLLPILTHPIDPLDRSMQPEPTPPRLRREQDYFVWHVPYRCPGFSYYRESAIRRGKYKLLKNWDGDFIELYDLEVDFEERVNLVSQKPEVARDLEALLLDYLQRVDAEMDVAPLNTVIWEKWQRDDQSLTA